MHGDGKRATGPRAVFTVLWAVFFFQGMTLGCWFPSLTNIFVEAGLKDWVPLAFMVPPFCALIGPLIGGALADQRLPANRLYLWATLLCVFLLEAAFFALDAGWHPFWFLLFIAGHAVLSGPTWGFLATISMKHLVDAERQYPLVRVGATIGWIVGGLMTSYVLKADSSPLAGYAAGVVRLASVGLALCLPHTPPLGVVRDWRSRLGLDAFGLMKERDHLVFFVVTALFSIPITAFYMHGPEFLKALGDARPTGTMTIAQVLEIVSMLALGALLARHSVKAVLLWAIGLSVLRFAMSAQAGVSDQIGWHIGGLALHGVCYTLYFVTAQIFLDRRVEPGLRGQAQGLLMMVSGGLGPLVGAWMCGALKLRLVGDDGHGWTTYWSVLAGMIAVCFLLFAIFYRGLGKPRPGQAMPSHQLTGELDGSKHG